MATSPRMPPVSSLCALTLAAVLTAPAAVVADERYHFDAADLDGVQRRLKQRHVQM